MSLVGNLEDLGLGDILQIVSLSRKSGILYLRAEPDAEGRRAEGEIIFQNGQVIRATCSEASQNLGDLLVARGVITETQLEQALAIQRAGGGRERVGNVLIKHLKIPPEKIQAAIRKQTEAIVYDFFQWPRGDFSFELKEADGALDKVDLELRHMVLDSGLNPQFLAMEGTRLKDEAQTGRPVDPASRPVPPRAPAPHARNGHGAPGRDPAAERAPQADAPGEPPAAPPPARPAKRGRPVPGGPTVNLSEELGLATGQAALGSQSSRGLGMLRAMISELTSPEAHGQITLLILRFASEMMRRAVLFLVKDDEVVGLGQFGIEMPDDEPPDAAVRGIRIPVAEPSVFADVLRGRTAVKGPLADGRWNAHLVERLGGHRPAEAFCAPISSGGTIAAVLYADNAPEPTPIGDTEALEIFLHQAGLQMEKALLERRIRELNR